jgi:hypothetical protein
MNDLIFNDVPGLALVSIDAKGSLQRSFVVHRAKRKGYTNYLAE